MTDKQINKWLRRRFSSVGWVLLLYYGVMTVLTTVTAAADTAKQTLWAFAAGDFSGTIDYDAIAGNAWGYVASIILFLVVLDAWKGKDYWKQEILVKERNMKPAALLCFLCFCMGAQMANSLWVTLLELLLNSFDLSVMRILEGVSGDSDTFSMFFYASILAPVGEELLFRGYVLRTLRPYGKRFAILGSAVLFGLFHGNLLQTPYAILMGLVLGYVTVEYSLHWAVVLHMFNNLVLAEFLTRLTANWSDMAYSLLSMILFGGCGLLSVIILSARRSEIRAYRRSEWMDKRCLKCFFTSAGILALAVLMCGNMILLLFA